MLPTRFIPQLIHRNLSIKILHDSVTPFQVNCGESAVRRCDQQTVAQAFNGSTCQTNARIEPDGIYFQIIQVGFRHNRTTDSERQASERLLSVRATSCLSRQASERLLSVRATSCLSRQASERLLSVRATSCLSRQATAYMSPYSCPPPPRTIPTASPNAVATIIQKTKRFARISQFLFQKPSIDAFLPALWSHQDVLLLVPAGRNEPALMP